MKAKSPYAKLPPSRWAAKTRNLIDAHPLDETEIVEIVLSCWDDIFESLIGARKYRIGRNFFPRPQIMGLLLDQLIAAELQRRHLNVWRGEESATDKDLVYIPDESLSIEVKTSSSQAKIFGNRSYAQKGKTTRRRKKKKWGYYLAINFESFPKPDKRRTPEHLTNVRLIRFGWLDEEDWTGQKSETGQQANLSSDVETLKLLPIYRA